MTSLSAVHAALRGTNYYESYTCIKLPLSKLDFMAIPGLGGAVENWGLLQFDERRMLVNEVNMSWVTCASSEPTCAQQGVWPVRLWPWVTQPCCTHQGT